MNRKSKKEGEETRLYREIVENMAEGVFLIRTSNGIIVYANSAAERIFGYASGELTGKHISIINAPTDKSPEEVAHEITQNLNRNGTWRGDLQNLKKDGAAFWSHVNISTFDHPQYGRVWVSINQDITERKQAEELLLKSEERYHGLFNSMEEGVAINEIIFDKNGDAIDYMIIDANSAFEKHSPYKLKDAIGKRATDIYRMTPEFIRGWWKQHTQRNETAQTEYYHEPTDRWFYIVTTLPMNGRFATIFTDITERKRAETQLRQAEAKYRDIFENAIEGIFQSAPDGHFISVNAAMAHIFGYETPEEMIASIGDNIPTRIHADPDRRIEFIRALEQTGMVKQFEAKNRHKDGSLIWTKTSARIIRDTNGVVLYYEGFVEDITERKRAEEKLKEANKLLEEQLGQIKILRDYLREQAIRDPLTGLYNRRYLHDTMERELSRAKREHSPVSVMMIDIDHFKNFNDTYGHQAGDEILITLGSLLRKSVRQGDIACRYGGEEFIIIMLGSNEVDAQHRAEKIRHDFNNLRIDFDGSELRASISIGVAFYPKHGNNMNEIVKIADAALYEAKQAGRNLVYVWDEK